jgi:hypothetical protein
MIVATPYLGNGQNVPAGTHSPGNPGPRLQHIMPWGQTSQLFPQGSKRQLPLVFGPQPRTQKPEQHLVPGSSCVQF